MEEQNQNIELIKDNFVKSFIEAISSKSVEACADLVLNDEDNEILEVNYDLSKEEYRKVLLTQSENFLKDKRKFIDEKNAAKETAITLENFVTINTYEFEIPKEHPACFIKTISISMKKRLIEDVWYQVGFQIDDALYINGQIKINNLFTIRMSESYWDDINEDNTPFPLIEDKEVLRTILADHSDKEYLDILDYYHHWYLHKGDLTLDKYDLKVNLIVTGNLIIKEAVAEVRHELIVLGHTTVNALHIDESNDVLFLGGIEFKIGAFIMESGAYQIFNQPKGPILSTLSETIEIESTEHIQCCDASELDLEGDYSELLLDGFYGKDEDDDEDERFFPNMELIIETLRAGKTIFKE